VRSASVLTTARRAAVADPALVVRSVDVGAAQHARDRARECLLLDAAVAAATDGLPVMIEKKTSEGSTGVLLRPDPFRTGIWGALPTRLSAA
jgi:hypothetical protein